MWAPARGGRCAGRKDPLFCGSLVRESTRVPARFIVIQKEFRSADMNPCPPLCRAFTFTPLYKKKKKKFPSADIDPCPPLGPAITIHPPLKRHTHDRSVTDTASEPLA